MALAAAPCWKATRSTTRAPAAAPSLEVPPDLTQLSRDTRYVVPGGACHRQQLPGRPGRHRAADHGRVHPGRCAHERAGNQRWLVVNRPADQLWGPVREFWQENGFLLTLDQANLGIMETDWAENRAKLPQDFIRNALGKVFDSLYSTGERDRSAPAWSATPRRHRDLHQPPRHDRGLQQHPEGPDRLAAAPADPELEAEFLRRLMVAWA
jgi:outer membrane protein assembly factor BamC